MQVVFEFSCVLGGRKASQVEDTERHEEGTVTADGVRNVPGVLCLGQLHGFRTWPRIHTHILRKICS